MATDLKHAPTLAYAMFAAFGKVAPRYGVRLEGIEDDANEHSDFWQQVARELLRVECPAQRNGEETKHGG